eukprot:3504193-Amphidinium_carterae.1
MTGPWRFPWNDLSACHSFSLATLPHAAAHQFSLSSLLVVILNSVVLMKRSLQDRFPIFGFFGYAP